MELRNIDNEIKRHLLIVESRLHDGFAARTDAEIAKLCTSGKLETHYTDPLVAANLFFELIDSEYTALLRNTLAEVKGMFDLNGIGFRLSQINVVVHDYHRICCVWFLHDKEYVIDFMFDSSEDNPFQSFFKIGLIGNCSQVLDGDILHGTAQLIDSTTVLPNWFTHGLSLDS